METYAYSEWKQLFWDMISLASYISCFKNISGVCSIAGETAAQL